MDKHTPDLQWKQKVERALQARRLGQLLRKGKPVSFRSGVGYSQPGSGHIRTPRASSSTASSSRLT